MIDPYSDDDAGTVNVPRLRVSLRIRGDSLDPDFLTQQLGVAPTFSARKGDEVMRRDRVVAQRTGVWTYRLAEQPGSDMGEVVGLLLAAFPEDSTLWADITDSYAADVHCAASLDDEHRRTTIEPDVLAALGRRGLSLKLDIHAPLGATHEDDEDDEDEDDG
jgi:hypothetical protein